MSEINPGRIHKALQIVRELEKELVQRWPMRNGRYQTHCRSRSASSHGECAGSYPRDFDKRNRPA